MTSDAGPLDVIAIGRASVDLYGQQIGTRLEDIGSFAGYLRAHEKRRAFFRAAGATSTDHGHPSAFTADLPRATAEAL